MSEPIRDPYLDGTPVAPREETSTGEETSVGPARTSERAIAALVFSGLGVFCFPAIGGLVGIAVGVMARSEIEQSRGARVGKWLANLAIGLGALSLVGWVLLSAWGIAEITDHSRKPSAPVATHKSPARTPPTSVVPSPAPRGTSKASSPGPANRSVESGVVETRVGAVRLVDVGPGVALLSDELDRQRQAASASGETVVLLLVEPNCSPCNGVSAGLIDPKMQKALENVRLVRVDVNEFGTELRRLDVPTEKIPGFALLEGSNRPVDYLHGGEWDDDIPRNIAPVLQKFVRGKYVDRRHPWRRSDETPI